MLISREWLSDFVALPDDLDDETLAHDLTLHTVEVEGHERLGRKVVGVVGVVHDVDTAQGRWLVDVGAADLVTVAATQPTPDAPTIVDLGRAAVCTPADLGIAGMYPGRAEEPIAEPDLAGVAPGTGAAAALGLNDTVFEIDNKSLTNRPDLWGHYGIARELASIYVRRLLDPPSRAFDPAIADPGLIDHVDPGIARRFTIARIQPGVPRGRLSPLVVRVRLHRLGQRSLGLYADLTNYTMFATGQPSHAYDARRVTPPLSVRRGESGSLAVLSGGAVDLAPTTGVIASAEGPVAVAGIVGGSASQVGASTGVVLLEVGSFDATSVRRTSIDLGVRTDASARFEKGLDTQSVDRARGYLAHLIANHDPEALVVGHADVVHTSTEPAVVATCLDFLNRRMGTELAIPEVVERLGRFGFTVEAGADDTLTVQAPTWRSTGDIGIPNDILEEVARSIGYDELPSTEFSVVLRRTTHHGILALERRVREHLALRLLAQEVLTYPWATDELLTRTGLTDFATLRIDGAPATDRTRLRPSLVPNLLGAVETNLPFRSEFRLFEVGSVYLGDVAEPRTERRVGAAFVGSDLGALLRVVVGAVGSLGKGARLANVQVGDAAPGGWGDPVVRRDVVSDGAVVGRIAAVDLGQAGQDGNRRALFVEIGLDGLRVRSSRENRFTPIHVHPPATVDVSVWVPSGTRWEQIEAVSLAADVPDLSQVRLVDEFRDAKGRRSLTLRLHLSSATRTLDARDKAQARVAVVDALTQELAVTARE